MRSLPPVSESSAHTRAEITHRIGRFYTGQPSWRTRLRALRRRLGNASLPLSEEEQLIEVRDQILAENRAGGRGGEPVHALRFAHPLPPVLLAHDGRTTFRYVKALKNASTSIINLLLEITGEAAWRSWNADDHMMRKSPRRLVTMPGGAGQIPVAVNDEHARIHGYRSALAFAPKPSADIRFCVVRDPVERFLSGLNQAQIEILRFTGKQPSLTSAFIARWLDEMTEFYSAAGRSPDAGTGGRAVIKIRRHMLRQTHFLGKDASWYTHIFSARRPQEFHDFLSHLAGKPLSPFAANTRASRQRVFRPRGLSLERPQLSAAQRRRVEALYEEDYRVFGRWF